jgi:hypothetical protein
VDLTDNAMGQICLAITSTTQYVGASDDLAAETVQAALRRGLIYVTLAPGLRPYPASNSEV